VVEEEVEHSTLTHSKCSNWTELGLLLHYTLIKMEEAVCGSALLVLSTSYL
jgi:hypothetical protein